MSKLLFQEKQVFRQKALWLMLSVICGGSIFLFGMALYKQVIMNTQFGEKPMSDISLLIGFVLVTGFAIFLSWFFYSIKLETEVYEDSVKYKYWPFIRTHKIIPLSTIQSINVEKYRPIREYGGWGYRFSMKGRGLCLNVSKNKGLRIIMKDGYELLIGTQREEELRTIIQKINKRTI